MTPNTVPGRLRAAMKATNVTQAELARRTEFNPSTVSHWLKARRTPPSTTIETIAAALGIRAAWLAYGDGSMRDGPGAAKARAPRKTAA